MTSQPPSPYGQDPAPPGQPPAPVPGPPGYYPPPYAYPVSRGTNTMAILSLVLSFVFSPAGIVLGHIARKQIRQTGEEGDGLALAGLIISYIFTGMMVAFCVVYVGFFVIFFGAMAAVGTA